MVPKSNDKCPKRHKETEQGDCEDGDREWSSAATNQGVPEPQFKKTPELDEAKDYPLEPWEGAQPLILDFWTQEL